MQSKSGTHFARRMYCGCKNLNEVYRKIILKYRVAIEEGNAQLLHFLVYGILYNSWMLVFFPGGGGGVHDLWMDGGLPPSFQKGTLF